MPRSKGKKSSDLTTALGGINPMAVPLPHQQNSQKTNPPNSAEQSSMRKESRSGSILGWGRGGKRGRKENPAFHTGTTPHVSKDDSRYVSPVLQQDWLHLGISRERAREMILEMGSKDGSYLVRRKENLGEYALTVYHKGTFCHFLLTQRNSSQPFKVNGSKCPGCTTLNEVMEYLSKPRVFMPCALDHPCIREPGIDDWRPIVEATSDVWLNSKESVETAQKALESDPTSPPGDFLLQNSGEDGSMTIILKSILSGQVEILPVFKTPLGGFRCPTLCPDEFKSPVELVSGLLAADSLRMRSSSDTRSAVTMAMANAIEEKTSAPPPSILGDVDFVPSDQVDAFVKCALSESWYKPDHSDDQITELLHNTCTGTFFIRKSSTPFSFVLCVKEPTRIYRGLICPQKDDTDKICYAVRGSKANRATGIDPSSHLFCGLCDLVLHFSEKAYRIGSNGKHYVINIPSSKCIDELSPGYVNPPGYVDDESAEAPNWAIDLLDAIEDDADLEEDEEKDCLVLDYLDMEEEGNTLSEIRSMVQQNSGFHDNPTETLSVPELRNLRIPSALKGSKVGSKSKHSVMFKNEDIIGESFSSSEYERGDNDTNVELNQMDQYLEKINFKEQEYVRNRENYKILKAEKGDQAPEVQHLGRQILCQAQEVSFLIKSKASVIKDREILLKEEHEKSMRIASTLSSTDARIEDKNVTLPEEQCVYDDAISIAKQIPQRKSSLPEAGGSFDTSLYAYAFSW
eukprot:UC4_evm3s1138